MATIGTGYLLLLTNNSSIRFTSNGPTITANNSTIFVNSDFSAHSLELSNDATILGNLTVRGDVTVINTTILSVRDPIIELASNNTQNLTSYIGLELTHGNYNLPTSSAFIWSKNDNSFGIYQNITFNNISGNIANGVSNDNLSNFKIADLLPQNIVFNNGTDHSIYINGTTGNLTIYSAENLYLRGNNATTSSIYIGDNNTANVSVGASGKTTYILGPLISNETFNQMGIATFFEDIVFNNGSDHSIYVNGTTGNLIVYSSENLFLRGGNNTTSSVYVGDFNTANVIIGTSGKPTYISGPLISNETFNQIGIATFFEDIIFNNGSDHSIYVNGTTGNLIVYSSENLFLRGGNNTTSSVYVGDFNTANVIIGTSGKPTYISGPLISNEIFNQIGIATFFEDIIFNNGSDHSIYVNGTTGNLIVYSSENMFLRGGNNTTSSVYVGDFNTANVIIGTSGKPTYISGSLTVNETFNLLGLVNLFNNVAFNNGSDHSIYVNGTTGNLTVYSAGNLFLRGNNTTTSSIYVGDSNTSNVIIGISGKPTYISGSLTVNETFNQTGIATFFEDIVFNNGSDHSIYVNGTTGNLTVYSAGNLYLQGNNATTSSIYVGGSNTSNVIIGTLGKPTYISGSLTVNETFNQVGVATFFEDIVFNNGSDHSIYVNGTTGNLTVYSAGNLYLQGNNATTSSIYVGGSNTSNVIIGTLGKPTYISGSLTVNETFNSIGSATLFDDLIFNNGVGGHSVYVAGTAGNLVVYSPEILFLRGNNTTTSSVYVGDINTANVIIGASGKPTYISGSLTVNETFTSLGVINSASNLIVGNYTTIVCSTGISIINAPNYQTFFGSTNSTDPYPINRASKAGMLIVDLTDGSNAAELIYRLDNSTTSNIVRRNFIGYINPTISCNGTTFSLSGVVNSIYNGRFVHET